MKNMPLLYKKAMRPPKMAKIESSTLIHGWSID